MLPELLFSVGNSMQDISRDDFNLLNGSDKDVGTSRTSPMPATPPSTSSNCFGPQAEGCPTGSPLDSVCIKLEDSSPDVFSAASWHHPHHHHAHLPDMGSSKLLLRNSDDPLISRGATAVDDDNGLHPIVPKSTSNLGKTPAPAKASTSKRNRNPTANGTPRTRRKGAFKLRFHHQALPAEYLNHYEATQNQLNQKNASHHKNISESQRSQANSNQKQQQQQTNAHETVRNWLQKISEAQIPGKELRLTPIDLVGGDVGIDITGGLNSPRSPRKMVNYSDLPYMGEMTLENSKPRRGRKPKKADICHLIYKNYGTIFPGTPKDRVDVEAKGDGKSPTSLLEKRLSSDLKDSGKKTTEEPLNLCLRDHQSTDSLTISSDDDESDDLIPSSRTTPTFPADAATDALLAANLKMSLPNFQSALLDKSSDDTQTPSTADSDPTQCIYWPNAGVFIHPMALYYQKMIDAGTLPPPSKQPSSTCPSPTIQATPSLGKKTPSPKISAKSPSQLMRKDIKPSETPEPCSTPSSTRSNGSLSTIGTATNTHPPQKRKRSAIFIPPMPAENTTNPATEVSICKFKFTGGAKPSLQEKKMLSVDSDGNYRYYSGTGDKSMRGYEFFPRESLQQSGGLPGVNCANAFLNATGEKISNDIPPSVGLSNELLQIPETPPDSLMLPQTQATSGSGSHHRAFSQASDRRKRKSRRCLQREKLEQSFAKGFLIQTQKLDSAEGFQICKFRQLRKFTRYLFRSWRHHLPGDLQNANVAAVAAAAAADDGNSRQANSLINANNSILEVVPGEKSRKN